jgi:hypothetical protein
MWIRHHTHCSLESVVERGPGDPSLSSVCERGRRVVETSTGYMYAQGLEDRITVRDGLEVCCSETPTDQCIIYNIKRVVRKLVSSCENDLTVLVLEFPLPLPRPPKKKFTTYSKRLPIKTSSSPMWWPRCRFPWHPPSTNQLCGPHRGFSTDVLSKDFRLRKGYQQISTVSCLQHVIPDLVYSIIVPWSLPQRRRSGQSRVIWCRPLQPRVHHCSHSFLTSLIFLHDTSWGKKEYKKNGRVSFSRKTILRSSDSHQK